MGHGMGHGIAGCDRRPPGRPDGETAKRPRKWRPDATRPPAPPRPRPLSGLLRALCASAAAAPTAPIRGGRAAHVIQHGRAPHYGTTRGGSSAHHVTLSILLARMCIDSKLSLAQT